PPRRHRRDIDESHDRRHAPPDPRPRRGRPHGRRPALPAARRAVGVRGRHAVPPGHGEPPRAHVDRAHHPQGVAGGRGPAARRARLRRPAHLAHAWHRLRLSRRPQSVVAPAGARGHAPLRLAGTVGPRTALGLLRAHRTARAPERPGIGHRADAAAQAADRADRAGGAAVHPRGARRGEPGLAAVPAGGIRRRDPRFRLLRRQQALRHSRQAVAAVTVVVVGGGHNALVAAAYLARAGHAVEVIERDEVLGGAVSTVERFPGHRVDRGSSAHIMIRHTGIVEELELARYGLRYLDCDPWGFAPAVDGPPIVFHRDLDATCASIERACGARDADAYRRFVAVWGPRGARVMRAFGAAPRAPHLLRSFWGLDTGAGGSALSREFLQSGDALLDSWFADERLKAALAWFGAQSGPPMSEPGTAPMVGFAALMHTLPPGRAVGGSGALTEALAARLRADGATISTGEPVTELRRAGEGWLVRTAAGREIRAEAVIAGAHVLTTLDLLAAGGFDETV